MLWLLHNALNVAAGKTPPFHYPLKHRGWTLLQRNRINQWSLGNGSGCSSLAFLKRYVMHEGTAPRRDQQNHVTCVGIYCALLRASCSRSSISMVGVRYPPLLGLQFLLIVVYPSLARAGKTEGRWFSSHFSSNHWLGTPTNDTY